MKNSVPSTEACQKNIAMFPAENARERNMRNGSIGSRARSSQRTNATMSSAPMASAVMTSTLPQPAELPRTSPHTTPNPAPVTSTRPRTSSAVFRPKLSPIRVSTSGINSTAIGTFSQKIHGHEMPRTTAPPKSGPHRTENPITLLKIPIAHPRRSPLNASPTSASARGITRAAPAPCRTRPAISQLTSGDTAHIADAAANSPRPAASW
jgi:hypothetical protein